MTLIYNEATPNMYFEFAGVRKIPIIFCSFFRYDEFRRCMSERPYEQRIHIVAADWVSPDLVFYRDEAGAMQKYRITDEDVDSCQN